MKKLLGWCLLGCVILSGCAQAKKSSNDNEQQLKTSGQWSSNMNYLFAIGENTKYSGDKYQPGMYEFKSSSDKMAGIYDIYITDHLYEHTKMLSEDDLACTVGGLANLSCKIDLTSGEYVYVMPYAVDYDKKGVLTIKQV